MTPTRRGVLAGLAALAARPVLALPEPPTANVRRRYLDGPYGQLHLREARPSRGRATAPPIVLLHQSPLSGRMFDRLLPYLATDRVAIAVDTPGYGESDRPATRPPLSGYGDALLNPLRRAYGPRLNLVGYHTGAAIAAELAARRPTAVPRVVLISMPFFDAERRADLLKSFQEKRAYADDGSHLLPLWTGSFRTRAKGQSLDEVARLVAEKQRAGLFAEWALAAAMEIDFATLLPKLQQPTLVLAPHDGLEDECRAAAALLPHGRLIDLPNDAYGLFDAAPRELADLIHRFLKT